ncbi:MAG TPA: hypothetical protein VG604_03270, partial [Candidatus Saccharimonadales bacterium]|nr:hypothetical protein [Candidatus Saccharimonadales bacterium]
PKPLLATNSPYNVNDVQQMSEALNIPFDHFKHDAKAFASDCQSSLTAGDLESFGPIPEMFGDARAVGKACIVRTAVYFADSKPDFDNDLTNHFYVVCDPKVAENTGQPTATLDPSASA